jgi:hypothetical protein
MILLPAGYLKLPAAALLPSSSASAGFSPDE